MVFLLMGFQDNNVRLPSNKRHTMIATMTSARWVRFGVFEVDLRSGELRKQGAKIKLQEKPFQILALLLERSGDVVTREELREKLWPEDTFVDFDNSLNTAMSKLREALGESAGSPRFIETLPRRGYRFIGEVAPAEGENGTRPASAAGEVEQRPAVEMVAAPTPATSPPARPVRQSRRWLLVGGLAAAVIVASSVGSYLIWRSDGRVRSITGRAKLVVLPFKDLSGDPEQAYFTEGLTEEMISQLGRLNPDRLSVIARTSAMQYRNTTKDVGRIARELGVDYVLEGSLRRSTGRLRITAQLIDAREQTQLWSETYERDQADTLALQSDIAKRIASSLALELLPSRDARRNPQAYEEYLRGRFLWNKRNEPAIRRSIDHFREAIARDSGFASAHSGLADAYIVLETYSSVSAVETLPKAKEAALRALQLNPNSAEAHNSLAAVHHLEWNWTDAEKEFRQAIELNPNYATARQWYAEMLTMRGRLDEALREARRAQELDPLSVIITHVLGYTYYVRHQFDEAIAEYRRALSLDPVFYGARFGIANTYEQKGMYKEAVAEWTDMMTRGGRKSESEELIRAFESGGFPQVIRIRHRQLLDRTRNEYVAPLLAARVAIKAGQIDVAFDWLEKAFAERRQQIGYLKVDPVYETIRSDPRYKSLLSRMHLD